MSGRPPVPAPARPGRTPAAAARPWFSGLRHLAAGCVLLALTGCASFAPPRAPEQTTVATKVAVLPARIVSNFFLVEARQADGRTYRFLLDTGSSATYASPALARALGVKGAKDAPRTRRVRGAQGGEIELPTLTLGALALGDTRFEHVPALLYDFADISGHLGLTVDGVIGFPLFRDALVTLDYPRAQLVLAPVPAAAGTAPAHSATLAFNNEQGSPLIPLQMGNESFIVLIDSGSDGGLSLNPAGLHPRFVSGPRIGPLVSSLTGDRRQLIGRLAQNVTLGAHTVEQPITDLTDQLSALGGEFLRNFAVTFDQHHNQVTFQRDTAGPVRMAARRSTGLSFGRTPAYWRVLTVVPDTPAAQLPVQAGDLCVRVNGEPVEQWDSERYAALLRSAAKVTYTFLQGPQEADLEVPVIDLVP